VPDLLFIRSSAGLLPADDEAREWLAELRYGVTVAAKVRVPRNIKFHRKFWAMMRVAYANWDKPTIETPFGPATCPLSEFSRNVRILAGYGEPVANTRGEWRMQAKSISFSNMDESEFEKVYNACLNVIFQRFLPDWDNEVMQDAINQMMDFW